MDPIVHTKQQLQAVLDTLESTGSLQKEKRMDIETLLNPADESTIIDEVTDKDIYQAVMDLWEAQEHALANRGDDDIDHNANIKPCLTRREVLQAAAIINRYLNHENNSLAWKLDALLSSFKSSLHLQESINMRPTCITSYFSSM